MIATDLLSVPILVSSGPSHKNYMVLRHSRESGNLIPKGLDPRFPPFGDKRGDDIEDADFACSTLTED
jgi:hypothetical protein